MQTGPFGPSQHTAGPQPAPAHRVALHGTDPQRFDGPVSGLPLSAPESDAAAAPPLEVAPPFAAPPAFVPPRPADAEPPLADAPLLPPAELPPLPPAAAPPRPAEFALVPDVFVPPVELDPPAWEPPVAPFGPPSLVPVFDASSVLLEQPATAMAINSAHAKRRRFMEVLTGRCKGS
jgi:hypothetical protein